MEKTLVLGTGVMGLGIAQALAAAGCKVYLASVRDFPQMNSERTLNSIGKIAKGLDKLVSKGKMKEEQKAAILDNITPVAELDSVVDSVDLVLEAAAEDMDIKKRIFKHLDDICKQEIIFSTNSSALSITELGNSTSRPNRFLGVHFFNPAPIMALVEIVKGEATAEEVVEKVESFIKTIGKTPIIINEAPGFVVNRILVPMINEAAYALMEGVASAEDIDTGMKLGANHPIGPLALADLIGIDVCLAVMETLYNEFGDSKYRPCPLMRKLVRAGFLGRKTGRGFFNYV
jgi:3-hydroxybutyryl-CoA dehydrogenase